MDPRHLVSRLDGLAEVAWYTQQLRRVSDARDTDANLDTRVALLAHLATTAHQALRRSRSSTGPDHAD
ncbi:MAG TPA: hypothetical protein VFH02_10615 [Jiangellaceae bacterium]|nr:hypothetical protein [Jiangellaceae bacterium]